ncbi:hypothetical protein GF312_01535 [Candidatus Poribacteria bacterium]|nr:hypothetical protein [Candidatus Poribacteria bacterium]
MSGKDNKKRLECPNIEVNKEDCTCGSEKCPRRGFCCECIENHRSKGQLPACLRDLV